MDFEGHGLVTKRRRDRAWRMIVSIKCVTQKFILFTHQHIQLAENTVTVEYYYAIYVKKLLSKFFKNNGSNRLCMKKF